MDSAVRVVVSPSQSSYFAGESFSVTITFTNTRSAEATPPLKFVGQTHKRGAHSISSAPIARPPTSPGTPRTPTSAFYSRSQSRDKASTRKGLVGNDVVGISEGLPGLLEQRRKKMLAKSLSVSIAPRDLEAALTDTVTGQLRQPSSQDIQYVAPSSPHTPSPLSRSSVLSISPNHPHARKLSVLDGQAQFTDVHSPPANGNASPPAPAVVAQTPTSSTFSLALDPIAETSPGAYPPTPGIPGPSVESPSTATFASHSFAQQQRHVRRTSQLGLGLPPSISRSGQLQPPRTAVVSTLPQPEAELILYSYAQLSGTFTITSPTGVTSSYEQSEMLNSLRSSLFQRSAIGGGSMDISSTLSPPPTSPRRHSRSSSFSSGLLSLLSPSALVSSTSAPSSSSWTRQRTLSGSYSNGLTSPSTYDVIDPDTPLPTLELQPAMLAVDMTLLPGESRTYTYNVSLPNNLPPTFKGRSLKFSYELVIGTCRASSRGSGNGNGSATPLSAGSISRIMKVPIRMYNHVSVSRPPTPYDLMWPLSRRKFPTPDSNGRVIEEPERLLAMRRAGSKPPLNRLTASSEETSAQLKEYAQKLIASIPEPGSDGVRESMSSFDVDEDHLQRRPSWMGDEVTRNEGTLTGCREAVEILTRIPKKASYDVNKDGVKVADLTFTKSAFRLGETVTGVVELNSRTGRSRVLQLTALLESQESFPSLGGGAPSNTRLLRRVHAEHHALFTLSSLRTTFSLDIPSDASPAFQVKVGTDYVTDQARQPSVGGLEWKVRLCLSVAIASESSEPGTEGVRMKGFVRDGPRGEWGSSWRPTTDAAPMQKLVKSLEDTTSPENPATRSWASLFAASILGSAEGRYHDGDELESAEDETGRYDGIKANMEGGVGVGVTFGGGEAGWSPVKIETVECEVPIKVWPGNTAFKAMDVTFDV